MGAYSKVGIGDARKAFQSSDMIDIDKQERQDAMWRLGRVLPRTILLVLSVLLGVYLASFPVFPGSVLAWELGTPHPGVLQVGAGSVGGALSQGALRALQKQSVNQLFMSEVAPHANFALAPAASTRNAMPSVVSLIATPPQAAPLDTVTFAATLVNDGLTRGPYRATLQLLPESGAQLRSLTQSGFMVRHNQRLTLYWEWRAGKALPLGLYAIRVQLGTLAAPKWMFASYTARQRLTIIPR